MEFDTDQDTVDEMATHEFYISKHGSDDLVATIPGKPDADPAVFEVSTGARVRHGRASPLATQ